MSVGDSFDSLRDFWRDFSKSKSGLFGLGLLLVFLFLAIFGNAFVPYPDATEHWHDIKYWQDNPPAAPPSWTNVFAAKKGTESTVLIPVDTKVEDSGTTRVKRFVFEYDFQADTAPRDLVVKFQGNGQVPVTLTIDRPDGRSQEIYRDQTDLQDGIDQRISFASDTKRGALELIRSYDENLASTLTPELLKSVVALFNQTGPDMALGGRALKGKYTFTLAALLTDASLEVQPPTIVVSGSVSGILGTDLSKRDIFTGLIVGLRWALLIGIVTSILTVVVGVILGVVAAYFGGVVDWVLNRIFEFIYLLPVIPFLIVVSAVFKPSIWTLVIIICLFFWTGAFKPVYSMALQIREETFVEASKALGGSRARIILRHIVPILLPFSFAVMALNVPTVIVYEATISLIGLGDATIVTWGQILHDAFGQGAVINNLWWWVVPPGLMMVLMGMSFAFLGTALDKILHPKLKTR